MWIPVTRPTASSGKRLSALSPARRLCRPFKNAGRMVLVFSIVELAVALGHRRKGRVSTRRANHRAEGVRTPLDRVPRKQHFLIIRAHPFHSAVGLQA